MESYYKITDEEKQKNEYFNFYLNLLDDQKKNYINDIFKVPKLPLIGIKTKKNNNSHTLGKLMGLICFQIDICQGKQSDQIEQLFTDFTLPEHLKEYLNIDEVIEIDNNTDEPNNNLFFMPKKKLNFYFIVSDLPEYPSEQILSNQKNNFEINDKNNKNNNDLINIINENENENYIENDKNNKNYIENDKDNLNKINIINDKNDKNDKNENYIRNKFDAYDDEYEEYEDYNDNMNNFNNFNKNDYLIYNIIPHFFYLDDNEKDLLEVKNLNFQEQITLFEINSKEYFDISKDNSKTFIDINNLRAETSNIILDNKNNFTIKDNLKFYLNIRKNLSQFYLIYTTYKNDYHSVFYYITCNNLETKNKMENILNKSKSLKEVLSGIENCFGDKNDVVKNLKQLFSI